MFEGITSATFSGVLDTIKELIPIVLPAVVGFLAFRKGWSFLKGEIRKAQFISYDVLFSQSQDFFLALFLKRRLYEK